MTLNAKSTIKASGGISYTEEAFIVIFRKQIAPYISFSYGHSRIYGLARCSNGFSFDMSAFNVFLKNRKFYWTDKTFALDISTAYRFEVEVPYTSRVRFFSPMGFKLYARWDRHSLGDFFWFSELRITPIPYAGFGIVIDAIPRLKIDAYDEIGVMNSVLTIFNKEEFLGSENYLHISNRINVEFGIRLHGDYYLTAGWTNDVNLFESYEAALNILMFFKNSFYMGFEYEF